MQSATVQHLAVQHSLNLTEFETEYDPEYAILWGFCNPQSAPIATLKLLEDVHRHDRLFEHNGGHVFYEGEQRRVNYYVAGSRAKGVYSLGGDLVYFMKCIECRDRDALTHYATLCVDYLYPRTQNYFNPNLITSDVNVREPLKSMRRISQSSPTRAFAGTSGEVRGAGALDSNSSTISADPLSLAMSKGVFPFWSAAFTSA